ncbi:MAG: helix-turn-helix domain-containing protein [Actinomycetospora chiangmaiensis]|nr:helix-turn-helix domain-containing protein [Actinomycetospora chiangmaiensis]
MTLPDLAMYLRFSEGHTRKLADEGQLGGWKIGSTWRFLKTDIDRRLLGGHG